MRFRVFIAAFVWVLAPICAVAQATVSAKTWSFALPHGTLEIEVHLSREGGIEMHIGPTQQGIEAPIAEQVQPLKKVLEEMLGLGLDPHKLDYVSTRTWSRDAAEKLARACADSDAWRLSVKDHNWKAQGALVISLLNQTGAYEPYNDAFKEYGIRVRVSEVEIPGLTYLSDFPPRDSRDRADAKLGVPAATYVGMRFSGIGTVSK